LKRTSQTVRQRRRRIDTEGGSEGGREGGREKNKERN
jgi:hypothetical protein